MFHKMQEKPLRQILGIMREVSAPAGKRIERIPINLAENSQGLSTQLTLLQRRSHHQRPARRVKLGRLTSNGAIAHSHRNPACRVNTSESARIIHFFSSALTLGPLKSICR